MSFRTVLKNSLVDNYGNSIANRYDNYLTQEKISDEDLRYDLVSMSYKWSISEVFMTDIAQLSNKNGKQIFELLREIAQGYDFPPTYSEAVVASKASQSSKSNTNTNSKTNNNNTVVSSKAKPNTNVTRATKAPVVTNASSGGGVAVTTEDGFVNVILKANTHSKFTSWQVFEYSHAAHFIDKLMVGSRMETEKKDAGELKVAIKKFAFVRVDKPFQYRLAVRTKSNKSADAQVFLDLIQGKLDAVLSGVTKLETFRYGQEFDAIMVEAMNS